MPKTHKASKEGRAQSRYQHKPVRDSPKLVVLCGPSHSGKTTFTRRLRGHFQIISSDEIRERLAGHLTPAEREEKVWKTFDSLKCAALKLGQNVILDACHMSRRARWHSLQGPNARHRKICIVFDLPFRAIRARCLKATRLSVTEAERMWRAFQGQKPSVKELRREGYDEVYFVKGTRADSIASLSQGACRAGTALGEQCAAGRAGCTCRVRTAGAEAQARVSRVSRAGRCGRGDRLAGEVDACAGQGALSQTACAPNHLYWCCSTPRFCLAVCDRRGEQAKADRGSALNKNPEVIWHVRFDFRHQGAARAQAQGRDRGSGDAAGAGLGALHPLRHQAREALPV